MEPHALAEGQNNKGKLGIGRLGVMALLGRLLPVAAALLVPSTSFALPIGGQAVAGDATVASASDTSLAITQASQRAILNWQSFGIAPGENVVFRQPNASAVTLNRVLGSNPSEIQGRLSANGQVFLVNPNGVLFGPSASVDVGGLVATTLAISNQDFLAGQTRFAGSDLAGSLRNSGRLTANAYVALIAPDVANDGTIAARNVALAAGKKVSLDFAGDDLLKIKIDEAALNAAIDNSGALMADGGRVVLTARAVGDLVGTVINQSGIIEAKSLSNRNGQIVLDGGTSGSVNVTGTLDAASDPANVSGGSVSVAGDILLQNGAIRANGSSGGAVSLSGRRILGAGAIDASGAAAGGTIAINATDAMIQTAGQSLAADGGTGPGGKITLNAGNRLVSSASASAAGAAGGKIGVFASDISLVGARLDASGDAGGGSILIGGDFHGGPVVGHSNAHTTLVTPSTAIAADARKLGAGGKVVVWSDSSTEFYGSISARGGAQGGDGGSMEVSGRDQLIFGGSADAGAAHGQSGALLLDPKNITISSAGVMPQYDFVDPNPGDGGQFGSSVTALSTGNYVITDPLDSFAASSAGAAYLFNGKTGALISALNGSQANDKVGTSGVTALSGNGNYVVASANWSNGGNANAGAVTFGNGTTGVSGAVSSGNSLVGSTLNDKVGNGGITALSTGSYVVNSPNWSNGGNANAGAVTFGSGTTGVGGAVSAANSLVGSSASDKVGSGYITLLTNGNYVVASPNWSNAGNANAGAETFGSGTTGVSGAVSSGNSLVGSAANDQVGVCCSSVKALTNGNYVVASPYWDNGAVVDAGAATFGNGTTGVSGVISAANSLVGSSANDQVGNGGITLLTNGNYVVASPGWDNGAVVNVGAATFGSGATGVIGPVSAANSLVGSSTNDGVGNYGVTALTNGNFVVISDWYNGGAGAVTFGSGTTGVSGPVSGSNSLVGSSTNDHVGFDGIAALANGNYLVFSSLWNNVGAVTFGSGTTGVSGAVSATNSLVGSTPGDEVGYGGSIWAFDELSNGNYVIESKNWHNGGASSAGAVTWGSGTTGVSGVVSSSNSLVGSTGGDYVGELGVIALANGNYVVPSREWHNGGLYNAGAVTFGNGTTGVSGVVSADNSLVGSNAGDQVGAGVWALTNGNYVVISPQWKNGANAQAGAATFGSGTTGVSGVISAANSLVGGTAGDVVGMYGVTALANGNYLVRSPAWHNGANNSVGAVTFGNGATGVSGLISAANSLTGSTAGDNVGYGVTALSNSNYLVNSTYWHNGGLANAGALTWVDGATGATLDGVNTIEAQNSLLGTTASTSMLYSPIVDTINSTFVTSFKTEGSGRVTAGFVDPNLLSYDRATSQSLTVTPAFLTRTLNTGTAVVLQAANDITVSDAITSSNGGSGGALTLAAGRSVLVNADISTDNAAINLVANDTLAHGVVDAQRDAGAAAIAMAAGTTLASGNGNINVTLGMGAGLTNSTSGNITLDNLTTTGNVLVANNGPTAGSSILRAQASSLITASSAALDVNGASGGGSIGSSANPMRVTVSNLEARSQSGGAYFDSPAQGLTVGGAALGGFTGISTSSNGDIAASAAGTVNVVEAISADGSGSVTLTANGGGDISNSAAIGTGSGPISLLADNDIAINASVGAATAGAVTLMADNDSSGAGAISQSQPLTKVTTLTASGTSVTLNNAGNTVAGLGAVTATAGATSLVDSVGLTLSGALTASGAGDAIVLALGGKFINSFGATALNAPAGRWLVWSADPAADTRGGLAYDFKQYDATYGVTAVQGAGNGFLYMRAPTITPSLVGSTSKVYDGKLNATLDAGNYLLAGAIDGDTVTLNSSLSATYDSKNVGVGKLVSATGLTISSATNGAASVYGYQVVDASGNIGTITKAPLTLAPVSDSKTYDGTTNSAGTVAVTGAVADDSVTVAQQFDSKNASALNGRTLTIKPGYTIVDAGSADMSGNYSIADNRTAMGTINAKAVTLTAPVVSKTYDGGLGYATSGGDLTALSTGLVGGDTVSAATIAYTDKNVGVGNKTVILDGATLGDGNDGANYSVTLAGNASSTITAKAVTLTAPVVSKTYDGGTGYTTQGADLTALSAGLVGDDTVTAAGIRYSDKNFGVGNRTATLDSATLSDGNGGNNYTVTLAGNNTSTINKAALVANVAAADKVYDGTPTATITSRTVSGVIGGDVVSLTGGTASFDTKNVGTGKIVTATDLTLAGLDAGNYTANSTATTTADITPASLGLSLTAGITAADKVYDGTTAATITGRSLLGVIGGDVVSLTGGTATFDNKNVGTAKTVTAIDLALSGPAAGNYTTNSTATTTADITPASLTASVTAANKLYDATTAATITSRALSGVIGGDAVSLTGGTASFDTKNVGTGKTVTAIDLALSGPAAGNYTTNSTATTTADITPASLTASVTAADKVYDATTAATITSRALSGVIGGDAVSLTGGTASFDTKNVGTGKTVTATDLTLAGLDAGNYTANSTATTTADITPAQLLYLADSASRAYGQANPAFTGSVTGLRHGETLADVTTGSLIFSSIANSVSPVGNYEITGGGLSAANYSFSQAPGNSVALQVFAAAEPLVLPPVVPLGAPPLQLPMPQTETPIQANATQSELNRSHDDVVPCKSALSPNSLGGYSVAWTCGGAPSR
ncbi:heme/hemopexin-binding protein precursor [mine drainage metagenome]|uniref:Heme/hemopexin-binding protein n=1 Tax=mine drainage metagenome TaxID=410659 RepID=A0A1J5RWW3_9ZZZZ